MPQKRADLRDDTRHGDAQLDRAGPHLPIPVAVAGALLTAIGTALAWSGIVDRLGLQLHQSLGGNADHLTQKTGVGGLLQKRGKHDLVFGHRGGSLG